MFAVVRTKNGIFKDIVALRDERDDAVEQLKEEADALLMSTKAGRVAYQYGNGPLVDENLAGATILGIGELHLCEVSNVG